MIDYTQVVDRVIALLRTRKGLSGECLQVWAADVANIFCYASYCHSIPTEEVIQYLDMVECCTIRPFIDDGKTHHLKDLLPPAITNHRLFRFTEHSLLYHKPGKNQTGPAEFFVCFYDKDSTYSASSTAGYDVILHNLRTEFKKAPSNFESPTKFDLYQASPVCDRIIVVKPISNAPGARVQTQYVCVTFANMHWSEAFEFHPKKNSKQFSLHYKHKKVVS